MFGYTVSLALEGMDSARRDDPIWLNEVSMVLDRIAFRVCAEHGVQAIAEEFRLDMAEAKDISRREIIRLQAEIAVLRERQELFARRQLEIQERDDALKARLEKLAADIEAFYVRYGYQKQGNAWIRPTPSPPNPVDLITMLFPPKAAKAARADGSAGSAPSPGGV